jgi:hypothetical protein
MEMDMEEFAYNLLDLWDEYRGSNTRTFQPTMTDFMEYVRDKYASQQTEHKSDHTRTGGVIYDDLKDSVYPAPPIPKLDVNAVGQIEASVAKATLRTDITTVDVVQIRELYQKGLSLARIRERLGLSVSLNRLQTVVNKPW